MDPYRDLAIMPESSQKVWLVMSEHFDRGELTCRDIENVFYTEAEAEACVQRLTERYGFCGGHFWVESI